MIFNVPDEILIKIFKELIRRDIYQCQKVCRSWYIPAHLLVLERVRLLDNSDIDSFLKSVECNELYIKAVKVLQIGEYDERRWPDKQHMKRLILGLPYLQRLHINNSKTLKVLTNDTKFCKAISKTCTKIEEIECFSPLIDVNTYYFKLVTALRDSISHVNLLEDGTVQSLSGFTCLQHLDISSSAKFFNIQAWLPLFEQQHNLISVYGSLVNVDKEDFMQSYMDSKTKNEKDLIIENLSKLKCLSIEEDECFCPNSISFLTQYLTELENFNLYGSWVANWNSAQINVFCNKLIDFQCGLPKFCVRFWRISDRILSKCLPTIFNKTFSSAQRLDRKLHIHMFHDGVGQLESPTCPFSLFVRSSITDNGRTERLVELALGADQTTVDPVKSAIPANNIISTFIFDFFQGDHQLCYDSPSIYFSAFEQMLGKLPMVTKVVLDVPAKFNHVPKLTCPKVTHLELNACLEIELEETLNTCIAMFPETRYLKLNYFCGVWKQDLQGFSVSLQNTKLERLYLDVTPILIKTRKTFANQVTQSSDYFVLDIQTGDRRYVYKVSLDYLRITQVEDHDDIDTKDHVQISILVADLQFLNLNLYKDILKRGHISTYMSEYCINSVMESKISLV